MFGEPTPLATRPGGVLKRTRVTKDNLGIYELPGFAKATPWQASYDRQAVEPGGCAASSVAGATVYAPASSASGGFSLICPPGTP